MHCAHCQAEYTTEDIYCRQCGADLTDSVPSTSLVTTNSSRLPAVLYNSPVPRGVAASVGAVALGIGFELVRRGVLARLSKPTVETTLPALNSIKDILFPQTEKSARRIKKGYEVEETVVYMRRVIRR